MKNLLRANNLTLRIGHQQMRVPLNLQIEAGDVWGILGPNGSGKTTLLHTLAGLIPTEGGNIQLLEHNIASLNPKQIARHLGILFQDTHYPFPQTVFEFCLSARYPHLGYFSRENSHDKKITLDALTAMELDQQLSQNLQTLSGGEKRRLAIAALLTQKPSIYLLDEPTNHLDVRHQIKALTHFTALAKDQRTAVVMSLHDINLASHYCNKILMLFDDAVLQGHTREIMLSDNLSRLYKHPFRVAHLDGHASWFALPS